MPDTPVEPANPALERFARRLLKVPPVRFTLVQAELLLEQFLETAGVRKWHLLATAIMANHVHWVLGVPGAPNPETLLRDLKAYGSRKLNRQFAEASPCEWWAESGSKQKLSTEESVLAAIRYVIGQEYPLLIWTAVIPELNLKGGRLT